MGLQEPSWTHDPEPTQEILYFSFDFHTEEGKIIWLPVEATVTMNGGGVDIECSYDVPPVFFWLIFEKWGDRNIDTQILEDQLRDHFSEIYTEFDIEFNRI